MKTEIEILIDDITNLQVDVIVNAANNSLLGGGGVDGAIHKAAGPNLLNECRLLKGCNTGEAKITRGYNLPAKNVIHTVGPIWKGGKNNEDNLLKLCYLNSLRLAKENNLKTIAFPAISTGIYGYPIESATNIALNSILNFIKTDTYFEKIFFACFNNYIYEIYITTYNKLKEE